MNPLGFAGPDLARQIATFALVGSIGFCIDASVTVALASGIGLRLSSLARLRLL